MPLRSIASIDICGRPFRRLATARISGPIRSSPTMSTRIGRQNVVMDVDAVAVGHCSVPWGRFSPSRPRFLEHRKGGELLVPRVTPGK